MVDSFQYQYITFEQPVNEYVRLCLRIEHFLHQLTESINGEQPWQSRVAINQILHLSALTDRAELKTKLLHLLKQCRQFYAQLRARTDVDSAKLNGILAQADHYIELLASKDGRMADPVSYSELLRRIKLQSTNPAGVAPFNCPEYHLWLSQSPERRQDDLHYWSTAFDDLKGIIEFILTLVRESATSELKEASEGFYQERLDPYGANQLVSVSLRINEGVFPEISVGRQRVSIHFVRMGMSGFKKVSDTVPFHLNFSRLG